MNVLEGPSELLLFFEEAVNLTRADGSAVLERGDTVIMDNCGFHHGHLVEPILTALLANCGVRLLFQPPYSPEFNTCELCFHDIKRALATKSALSRGRNSLRDLRGMRKRNTAEIRKLFYALWILFLDP